MKHFGIITEQLEVLDIKQMQKLIHDKGFATSSISLEFDSINSTSEPEVLGVSKFSNSYVGNSSNLTYDIIPEIKEEYYSFLKNIFHYQIFMTDGCSANFFIKFDSDTYGQEFLEQKKTGLRFFNEIFSKTVNQNIIFTEQIIDKSGIKQTILEPRLKSLFEQQKIYIDSLADFLCVSRYLFGHRTFFETPEFYSVPSIKEFIQFEQNFEILVQLNSRFGFEPDYYFSNWKDDRIKFEKYKHIFKTLKSYQFTKLKAQSFLDDIPSKIDSLFEILQKNSLIADNRNGFRKFLFDEFGLETSIIKSYKRNSTNLTHKERINTFLAEWLQFDA